MLKSYRFENIKNLIDTEEYVSRFVPLKKMGQIYKGVCPFHNEKTPSFTLYPSKYIDDKYQHASFYCFGCGASGDIFEFRKRWESLNNKWEALELFEVEMGIDVNDEESVNVHLKEQIKQMSNIKDKTLSLSEINIICSIMCRNYLLWVKENYFSKYDEEKIIIDKYYLYFDSFFDEKSAIEANPLIVDVEKKLKTRRENLQKK